MGGKFNSSFKKFILTSTMATLVLFAPAVAHATYTVTLDQVGINVFATGSGSLNLSALSFYSKVTTNSPAIIPNEAALDVGFPQSANLFVGAATGPTSFGSGNGGYATAGNSGELVGMQFTGNATSIFPSGPNIILYVPVNYTSGSFLSTSTAGFDNTTLSGLGVTPGIYTWTWGTGANADSFVLEAGVSATPEPPTFWLMATGILGMFGWIGYRKMKAAV